MYLYIIILVMKYYQFSIQCSDPFLGIKELNTKPQKFIRSVLVMRFGRWPLSRLIDNGHRPKRVTSTLLINFCGFVLSSFIPCNEKIRFFFISCTGKFYYNITTRTSGTRYTTAARRKQRQWRWWCVWNELLEQLRKFDN